MATGTASRGEQKNVGMPELAGKYLTFKLAEEEYGLQILKVQEIIKVQDITRVPQTPAYVKGVINLRGRVIAVLDLRLKFGMPQVEATEKTCIVVVQVNRDAHQVTLGVIVDEVCDVIDIVGSDVEPSPSFGTRVRTDFILGMAKAKQGVKMLLDTDKVLSVDEVCQVSAVAAADIAEVQPDSYVETPGSGREGTAEASRGEGKKRETK